MSHPSRWATSTSAASRGETHPNDTPAGVPGRARHDQPPEAGDRAIEQGCVRTDVRRPRGGARPEQKGPWMPHIDIEILSPFAAKFMEGTPLTPAERSEVL